MNKDIQFLKEFQNERNTQPNDGNANPVFWVIRDYRTVPTAEDYADDWSYYYSDGDHTEFDDVESLKEFIVDYCSDNLTEEEMECVHKTEDDEFEELWDFVLDNLNSDGHFDSVPVIEEAFIRENTMFLTKAEAKRHIKLNHYHYTDRVHTYAMTAWRSPTVERLLNILETFDWNSIELKDGV